MSKNNSYIRHTAGLLLLVMVLSLFTPFVGQTAFAEGDKYGDLANKIMREISVELKEPRLAGTKSEKEVSETIVKYFKEFGYETEVQDFEFTHRKTKEKMNSQNVIAVKKGTDPKAKALVIGAHYDQVVSTRTGDIATPETKGFKGSQDNASGVGALLETAKRVAKTETKHDIIFVAFGAEEVGKEGSKAYVANKDNKINKDNIFGMINLDSVMAGDFIYAYAGQKAIKNNPAAGFLRDQALAISEELNLDLITQNGKTDGYPTGQTGTWSDHDPFDSVDIPNVYFESTNWELKEHNGAYVDGYEETAKLGAVMHTKYDDANVIEEHFPGRIAERLNTVTKVLERLVVEAQPEVRNNELTVSDNKIAMDRAKTITIKAEFKDEVKADDVKITLGAKSLDKWGSFSEQISSRVLNRPPKFEGKPWIKLEGEPKVEGKVVTATITTELPFGVTDLSGRPYPRWAYEYLMGNYDLKVENKANNEVVAKEMRVTPYDEFLRFEEMEGELKGLIEKGNKKADRYFEYEKVGESQEGRPMHFLIVAKNKEAVDKYLNVTKKKALENPEAFKKEIKEGKNDYQVPVFINNVHPDESTGIDAQFESIRELVEKDKIVFDKNGKGEKTEIDMKELLDDLIIVYNITQNPDGRALNLRHNANGFDLNRDNGFQTQIETKYLTEQIAKWNPVAFLDLHGFIKEFLIEPCTPPHEPNFEVDLMMGGNIKEFMTEGKLDKNKVGKPGAIEHSKAMGEAGVANSKFESFIIPTFDYGAGWDDASLGYTGVFAWIHGAMGHTIETPELNSQGMEAHKYTVLASLDYIQENKAQIFTNQLEFNRRGLENIDDKVDSDSWHLDEKGKQLGRPRGENENFFPEYYILPIDEDLQRNSLEVYHMINHILRNGAKVHKSTEAVKFDGVTYPKGSIVVDLHQAKRGFVNSALYTGTDESHWSAMYAELVLNFPAMRGFDKVEVREKGLFDGKVEEITKYVEVPSTTVKGNASEYVIRNTNVDAIKSVNALLNKNNEVKMVTKASGNVKAGDFVVSKANLETVAKDHFLRVLPVEGKLETKVVEMPKIYTTESGSYYSSTTDATVYALKDLGFKKFVKNIKDADIVVDSSGVENLKDMKQGQHYIALGGDATLAAQKRGMFEGLEAKRNERGWSHEGILKAEYDQENIITASYDAEDIAYTASGVVITKAPKDAKVIAKISNDKDFYVEGWWPGHDMAKGQIFAFEDKYNGGNAVVFAGDITNRAHPTHLYRLLTNSIYGVMMDEVLGGEGLGETPTEPEKPVEPMKEFKDIKKHWARKQIMELAEKGIVSGYQDNTFKPDGSITRAEFATILVKAYNLESKGTVTFKDTNKHWAKNIVSIAASNGVVSGYENGTFKPDAKVTREEMASMVVRAAKLDKSNEKVNFKDANKISKWAKDAVNTAAANKIITGYEDNTFRPAKSATRAEAVIMIIQALKIK